MDKQYAELANTIALQAQALADGKVGGPRYAAVRRLLKNVEMLAAWTPDDRFGAESDGELRTCYNRWYPDNEHECSDPWDEALR